MDTKYPVVLIRKYQTPIEDVKLGVPVPSIPQRHFELSAFERLPLEIRQMVYEGLDFSVAGKVWRRDLNDRKVRIKITHFEFRRWDSHRGTRMHREISPYHVWCLNPEVC
jgi:hypothetical protein